MTAITLKILDILNPGQGEFSEQQARAIAGTIDITIENAQQKEAEKFVTKERLYETEKNITGELSAMRQEMAKIDNRLTKIETTITTLATKEELTAMKFDILKWIMILFTINIITIVGAIIGVAKFIK